MCDKLSYQTEYGRGAINGGKRYTVEISSLFSSIYEVPEALRLRGRCDTDGTWVCCVCVVWYHMVYIRVQDFTGKMIAM